MTNLLQRDLSRVRAHSLANSALSNRQPSYPVVIMRAGMAALTTDYTTLAEDLASHGYVVVGLDAPRRTQIVVFPDGRRIARSRENNADLVTGAAKETMALRLQSAWSGDVEFVLDRLEQLNKSDPSDQFTGRLDIDRIGIWGHSLGGSTALEFCHTDHRCKAGVDVDGLPLGSVIKEGLHKPFMFLLSDHSQEQNDPESTRINANLKSIYRTLPPSDRFWVVLQGANHFGFSDGVLLKSPALQSVLHRLGVLGMDGPQQLAISRRCLSEFFDVYLKGAPRSEMPNLNSLSNPQP
jgi:dienelactone hydrolase